MTQSLLDHAREVLADRQWSGAWFSCPDCGGNAHNGHKSNCSYAALLADLDHARSEPVTCPSCKQRDADAEAIKAAWEFALADRVDGVIRRAGIIAVTNAIDAAIAAASTPKAEG